MDGIVFLVFASGGYPSDTNGNAWKGGKDNVSTLRARENFEKE